VGKGAHTLNDPQHSSLTTRAVPTRLGTDGAHGVQEHAFAHPTIQGGRFVELDRVSLRYGEDESGTLALQGTSLKVGSGEFVAIVGPSGCGKSTLMKVVTGLWQPSQGTAIVDGRRVNAPLSIAGMAFQNPTLLPWRSALANVMLPLEIVQPHSAKLRRERAAYESKARELLALVGLSGFEEHFPWQLSGGMQQRASLCRALIHDPLLLMLDEPFASLDMFTREELWLALQDLWLARRPTVILVTHDLREAVFLADRVLVMSARPGRIVAEAMVDLPRPRNLEMTYASYSVDLVHTLRERISAARVALS
jgi:NitT/TauT family transport system ATP-binding protein